MLRLFLKRWIFLFVIIVFDLLIALRTSKEFFYFFFWFLISVITISISWITIEYFSIKLSLIRRAAAKIEEDDILEIETVVSNNGFLPVINLLLEDYLAFALSREREKRFLLEYLGPGATSNLKYRCQCPRRGRYEIGPFSIYLFDPWGIFFFKKTFFLYSELYVYPRTFRIPKFPALTKGAVPWFGIETSHVSGDEHEFYGIREYKPGDPIRKIHWLSTARKNKLIVKQFQHQVFYRASIIFNLDKDKNFGEGKESVAEYIIKIAASVAKHFVERDVSVEIIAHIGEIAHIPFNKGPEHLEDIFRALTVARPESRISMGELLQEFSDYIPNDSSLIVIMLDEDWEFLPAMLSLKARNISLIPLVLVASSFLHPQEKQKAVEFPQVKLPEVFDFAPIFFSCGDNLEQDFLRY